MLFTFVCSDKASRDISAVLSHVYAAYIFFLKAKLCHMEPDSHVKMEYNMAWVCWFAMRAPAFSNTA